MQEMFVGIAERLKALRDIMDISTKEIADYIGISEEEYLEHEKGENDFSFTFLFKASQCLGVDITDLITGESPKLSVYTVVRKNKGLPIERRVGFDYQNLAYLFKAREIETFLVTAKYDSKLENEPIQLSQHKGQEFDYILSGSLKVKINDSVEVLNQGDSIYYDSGNGHGMIATGGEDCTFIAVVTNEKRGNK